MVVIESIIWMITGFSKTSTEILAWQAVERKWGTTVPQLIRVRLFSSLQVLSPKNRLKKSGNFSIFQGQWGVPPNSYIGISHRKPTLKPGAPPHLPHTSGF